MTFIDVNIRVINGNSGRDQLLPALADEFGLVLPLVDYFRKMEADFSLGTQRDIRRAIKRFCIYTEALFPNGFGTESSRKLAHHFRDFRSALLFGTVNEETKEDPTGLRWSSLGRKTTNRSIFCLTRFFIWLEEFGDEQAKRFNPAVKATPQQEFISRAAYAYKRSKAFLGHTWADAGAVGVVAHYTGRVREARQPHKAKKRFPDDQFVRLLVDGFSLQSISNLRDILISLLLHKGGLRVSEPMHIWVTDVVEDVDNGLAHVVIPHPSEGSAPGTWAKAYSNRANCLSGLFNRRPRNQLGSGDTEYAGWKSGFRELDVLWFEPYWGHHFMALWKLYLRKVAEIVPARERNHPYAFMAFDKESLGRPLTIDAFNDSYRRAVTKASLVPEGHVGGLKNLGLTPHGGRHAYGHRSKNIAALAVPEVRDMMHHATEDAQKVYTEETWKERMARFEVASSKLHRNDGRFAELLSELK